MIKEETINGSDDEFIVKIEDVGDIDLSCIDINMNSSSIYGSSDTITLTGATSGPNNICSSGVNWNSNTIPFADPVDELRERLEKLEAIIAEEKDIRDNCPAVKNAYDEYRFLLVLAKRNKGDLLTGD